MPQTPRCEEVIVQIVVVTRDEAGDKVLEQTSAPIKVLRNAQTKDFWGEVDKAVKAMQATPASLPKTTGKGKASQ